MILSLSAGIFSVSSYLFAVRAQIVGRSRPVLAGVARSLPSSWPLHVRQRQAEQRLERLTSLQGRHFIYQIWDCRGSGQYVDEKTFPRALFSPCLRRQLRWCQAWFGANFGVRRRKYARTSQEEGLPYI